MPESGYLADIILPLLTEKLFTYRIPEELIPVAAPGMRVIVQFGQRKFYTGIIKTIHQNSSAEQEYKFITSIPDDKPLVNDYQLKLWDWIADYYMCSLGEVYKAALPSGLKLESESKIIYNQEYENPSTGNARLDTVLEIIRNHSAISISDLSRLTGKKECMSDVKNLLACNAIFLEEKLKETLKPKTERHVLLSELYHEENALNELFEHLNKSPKQKDVLLRYVELSNDDYSAGIPFKTLSATVSPSAINSLIKKNIFLLQVKDPSLENSTAVAKPVSLNPGQEKALHEIKNVFNENKVCLLHGVTSSGKTEIYIHLIQEMLLQGKQVLYLLPEIALTTQIIERLKKVFGERTGIYHSRFSDRERVNVYNNVLSGSEQGNGIVLGVRSSVFLPYSKLGLIIVDEEHENTFKQFDPAPRYHARDVAIVLAGFHKANVLLGTATPSVESWENCRSGKFGLVELKTRFGEIKLPKIVVANIKESKRKKNMKSVFTPTLLDEMEATISAGRQVILFQNRRGYSSFLECEVCGHIPKCKTCDVSLTYHRHTESIICHYCGYTRRVPGKCDQCQDTRITTRGFGTELVSDEIGLMFPHARVARLDLDSSRSVKSYENIIHDFASGKTNVLVGTQMLSKGLDFDNVGLVGILNADQMLNYPDFRAYERSFQLMMQVSGRAGRRAERGKVVIQTSDPANPIIRFVRDNDFQSFYKEQISERQTFNYPPFVRLIRISIRHKELNELIPAASSLSNSMRKIFGNRVLGPQEPIVSRIQSYYIRNILLKIEKKSSFEKARALLRSTIRDFQKENSGTLKILIDVDPA
jgi:primosomal protein N' (replication factor Y) (superfamily II helicase)